MLGKKFSVVGGKSKKAYNTEVVHMWDMAKQTNMGDIDFHIYFLLFLLQA